MLLTSINEMILLSRSEIQMPQLNKNYQNLYFDNLA